MKTPFFSTLFKKKKPAPTPRTYTVYLKIVDLAGYPPYNCAITGTFFDPHPWRVLLFLDNDYSKPVHPSVVYREDVRVIVEGDVMQDITNFMQAVKYGNVFSAN